MVGEHIRTRKDGRWHHAIDCGDETVIHLAAGPPGAAGVLRSYRPAFISGAEVVEVVTHRERTYPANEVVARAYSRIGDPGLAAMFRDSEAFADWCATGRLPAGPANVAIPPPPAPAPAAPPPGPTVRKAAKRAPRPATSKAPGAKRRARPKRAAKKATLSKKGRRRGAKARR